MNEFFVNIYQCLNGDRVMGAFHHTRNGAEFNTADLMVHGIFTLYRLRVIMRKRP